MHWYCRVSGIRLCIGIVESVDYELLESVVLYNALLESVVFDYAIVL